MQQLNKNIEVGIESSFIKQGKFYVNDELIGNFASSNDNFTVKNFKII
jgi:hypothetical protein